MEQQHLHTIKASSSSLQNTSDCFQSQKLPCMFQAEFDYLNSRYCMALLGSVKGLGSWDRLNAQVAKHQGDGVWRALVELPVSLEIEYKWIIYDKIFFEIVEYEPGNNRKMRIGKTSVLIEDFDDGVQKITEITQGELDKLMLMSKLNIVKTGNGDAGKCHSQNREEADMPSGTEPFQYDDSLTKQLKNLNPRIYVPEEYKTGILKECLRLESYENASQLDTEKEHMIYRKPGLKSSLMQQQISDYGLETTVLDVDRETQDISRVIDITSDEALETDGNKTLIDGWLRDIKLE